MNTVRLGLTTLLLATGTLFVFGANAEDAQAPAPADSAALAADGGIADGDVDGDADAAPPPIPAFDEQPFPEEKSARPKKEEWKNAPVVALTEGSIANSFTCKTQRLREWIRIFCTTTTAKITVMCGSSEDIFITPGVVPQDWGVFPEEAELVFAVRRGDRRLIEWQRVEFGYKGANSVASFMVISELWLPGEEKPVIIAQ